MKYPQMIGAVVALATCLLATAQAAQQEAYRKDPKLLEHSKKYSEMMVSERPELALLLRKFDLQYLHELDPGKVYNFNLDSGEVTIVGNDGDQVTPAAVPGFSFGTPKVVIGTTATNIIGEPSTTRR